MHTLAVNASSTLATLGPVADRARAAVEDADASNTRKAYRLDVAAFLSWTADAGLDPWRAETVALFAAAIAGTVAPATLGRRLAGIARAFRARGLESPNRSEAVRLVTRGLRRQAADAGRTAQRQAAPIAGPELRAVVGGIEGGDLIDLRDRALILAGFHLAARRSELVALDVADVAFVAEGVRVRIKRSKTDQAGEGVTLGVLQQADARIDAVRALRAWLDAAGIVEGPIFRRVTKGGVVGPARLTDRAVALVIKKRVAAVGLDPARFAGHSLRAGLVTAAAASGASERVIANQSRHKSMPTLRKYIRAANVFAASENVGAHFRF